MSLPMVTLNALHILWTLNVVKTLELTLTKDHEETLSFPTSPILEMAM